MDSQVQDRQQKTRSLERNVQRYMSMSKLVLTLALLLSVNSYCHGESCPLNTLSDTELPSPTPVGFDEVRFNVEPNGSSATVRITNRDTRPINAFFMVVDFHVSGRYLLSMIYYLATSGELKVFKPAARISPTFISTTPISSSLLPGASYRDSAESSLRALVCPDEGRIAILQIAFAGGKSFDQRMPGWRVDPSLLYVEPWSLSGFPTQPISFSSRISVDEEGRARVVALGAVHTQPTDDSDLSWWLIGQIERSFKFVPAQYEGAPISSEINLLIRFYPDGEVDPVRDVPNSRQKSTITIVDLVSETPGKAYRLIYGGYPISGEPLHPPRSP